VSGTSNLVIHSVHFYEEHSDLISRLRGVVSSGLKIGNSVLIVATPEHRQYLVKALTELDVDVPAHAREGRFVMCDAGETLSAFMVQGRPNRKLFDASIGKLLLEAKAAARSQGKSLTVFGEMVAVLWEEGNKEGALELESLWNEVLADSAFHLHCAYPRWNFTAQDEKDIARICGTHSHVLGRDPAAA
jgi:hypothetical protein